MKAKKLRITGLYMLRRHSAAPGFRSPRSATPPTAHSAHIFASPGNLRFPLSGLQKRHIQPERYAQFFLKQIEKALTKIKRYFKICEWSIQ
jgi:hypothetical protein